MLILFVLFMTDFFLTHIGVQAQIIAEGNPLMVWVFNLPLAISLLVRLMMFLVVGYLPTALMKKYPQKIKPLIRKLYYSVAYIANTATLGAHLHWILRLKNMS